MLALKIHEQDSHPKSPASDEHLARMLATAEQTTLSKEMEREKNDAEFARLLALEEQNKVASEAQETKRKQEERSRVEAEKRKKDEDRRSKLREDEELAKRLEEEEKKQLQLRKDYELAKKLEDSEKKASPTPFQYPSVYPSHTYPSSPYQSHSPYYTEAAKLAHATTVHNRFCYCGNTQTYNNNHIYAIHTSHCNCSFYPQPQGNHGRKHVHDYRCCSVNHLHSATCYCVHRSHAHTYQCCSLNHTHDDYCNCIQK